MARGAVLRHFLDVGKPKSLQNLDYAFIILRYNAESRTDHAAPAYTDNILILFLSAGELLRLLQAPRKRTRPRSSLPPRPQLPQTPNRQSDACRQTLRQQKKSQLQKTCRTSEHFQFKMLRISNHTAVVSWEKCGFPAHFGPGGAVSPPRVSPFLKLKRSRACYHYSYVVWGEGKPLCSRERCFPSPQAPHPFPSALFQREQERPTFLFI